MSRTLEQDSAATARVAAWAAGMIGILVACAASGHAQAPYRPALDAVLPPRAEAIYRALASRLDMEPVMALVASMAPRWRLAGNPDYDRSLDEIATALGRAGFASGDDPGRPSYRVDTFPSEGHGWAHTRATLAIEEAGGREVVLSREVERVTLCINSWSTPDGGVTAPLVDIGDGTRGADYEGRSIAGAVVLADGEVEAVWTEAVRNRGALGVISTQLAPFTRPDDTPGVLQWGSIPYDEERRSFGFKSTPQAARRLRAALARGPVRVHADIAAEFHRRPNRTLSAEIPGTGRRAERVVLVAHVQEPGANDNASGAGALVASATAILRAFTSGALPAPSRTLTFLWLDEIRGSEHWLAADPARAARVAAMMSIDMAGEHTALTGGSFLIEKMPDPSAVWDRPSDPHSEWGRGDVDRSLVKGHFLNDLHLAVCLRRARDTGWDVQTHPYEGGSDHTAFIRAGVPALLNWHFTDRHYHTNLDTLDKVSGAEIGHVALSVATTAATVASADRTDAHPLRRLIDEAERTRLETERANAASAEIVRAWRSWYREARASIGRVAR